LENRFRFGDRSSFPVPDPGLVCTTSAKIVDAFLKDLKHTGRVFLQTPGFTAAYRGSGARHRHEALYTDSYQVKAGK
jgi:hypothetical protein